MKIVDKNGRLFGKVNLIDLFVVLILIVAVAAVAMKTFGNKAVSAVTSPDVSISYQVVCEDVPQAVADYCEDHVGEQLLSSGKLLDAHITACSAEVDAEGQVNLYFTIEGICSYSGNTYSLGSQEVRVGMEHLVKTSSIECTGIICDLETANG